MEGAESRTPLLTVEDVLGWVREREAVKAEQAVLAARLTGLETRLRFASMLMPPEKAASLIGDLGEAPDPSIPANAAVASRSTVPSRIKRRSVADGVLDALEGEKGGRPSAWIRNRVARDPELQAGATSHTVSNSLSRLLDRGQLLRENSLYYLPALWDAIKSGTVVEEQLPNVGADGPPTFTSRLTAVAAAIGKPFGPADLRAAASKEPELSAKVASNPNSVNSWIGRQLDRGNLVREGKLYRLTSKRDGAPNGDAAGAPTIGEAATSLNTSQEGGDGHGPATT